MVKCETAKDVTDLIEKRIASYNKELNKLLSILRSGSDKSETFMQVTLLDKEIQTLQQILYDVKHEELR